jgi:hypothetical protein
VNGGDEFSLHPRPEDPSTHCSLRVGVWKRWFMAATILPEGLTQFLRPFRTRLYQDAVVDRLVAKAKESYIRKRVFEVHNGGIDISIDHLDASRC